MALSCIISDIKRDMWNIAIFNNPPAFDIPLGGPRRKIAIISATENLQWLTYEECKKFVKTFTRFDTVHEHDRQTDRQTDTA